MLSFFENEVDSSDNVPKLSQKHSTDRGDALILDTLVVLFGHLEAKENEK